MAEAIAARRLARVVLDRYPREACRVLEEESPNEIASALSSETPMRVAGVVRALSSDLAVDVLASLDLEQARAVLGTLEPHLAAAMVARLEHDARDRLLGGLDPDLAAELSALAEYPRDTAGGLMDPRVTSFPADTLVSTVLRRIRRLRRRRIQDVCLTDPDGRLVGVVALQDLVLAEPRSRLREIVRTAPRSVQVTSSQDEVMAELAALPGGSLPVVDYDGRLVGVLRQSELVAAATDAATAELVTMVGASREERALSTPWFAVRKRLPWLEVNLATAFLAAAVVGLFEETIARNTALAVLLPVVAGQSGNTGAQALAVTMRGLALREIRVHHWLRVGIKEASVALLNGVAVAATTATAVYFWSDSLGLAGVIGVSMVLSMLMAGLAGAVIPMLLTALRQDPAQSSSIILTTVTDVAGFFSFLGIATLLSQWL